MTYRIRTIAERAGISPMTLRGWERRYGFPQPARTGSGYREFSEADLAAVLAVQAQIERGVATSVAIESVRSGAVPTPVNPEELVQRFMDAARNLREIELERAAADAESRLEPIRFCHEFALPALRFAASELDIAREHLASAVIRTQLRKAIEKVPPPSEAKQKGLFVLACPAGEEHEGGLLALALELRVFGARTVTLGANTPAIAIAEAARHTNAQGVGVSLVSLRQELVLPVLQEIVEACGPIPVVAGGPLARRNLRSVFAAGALFAESIEELIRVVSEARR